MWDVYFLTAGYSKKLEVKYRSCSPVRVLETKGLYLLTGMPSVISLWTLADYTYDSYLHVSMLLQGIATDKMASMMTWSARIFRGPASRSDALHGDKVTNQYNNCF